MPQGPVYISARLVFEPMLSRLQAAQDSMAKFSATLTLLPETYRRVEEARRRIARRTLSKRAYRRWRGKRKEMRR